MEQGKFKFRGYRIADSSITIKNGDLGNGFGFDFDMDGEFNDNVFTLIMLVDIEDENNVVHVKTSLEATFEVSSTNEEKLNNSFLYVNAPAIVFPYLRAYITALSSLSGTRTIVLPTLNLIDKGRELKAKMEAKQAEVIAE